MSVDYALIKDLLDLSILVYEYGNSFRLNKDQTLDKFLKEIDTSGYNKKKLKLLKRINVDSPLSTVEKFINDPHTDIQVGITKNDNKKRICIVFRGSESKKDWYHDLMSFKKKLHGNVYVHTGFYNQLHNCSVYDSIVTSLSKLTRENPKYDICTTGHSLGGALSTIFGYEYYQSTGKKITIVSFASPRVGNYYFKKSFESIDAITHYRVTNNRDLVTAIPMYKYYHTGLNICLYDHRVEFLPCNKIPWWRYMPFYCWNVYDHKCESYYKRLTNNKWS